MPLLRPRRGCFARPGKPAALRCSALRQQHAHLARTASPAPSRSVRIVQQPSSRLRRQQCPGNAVVLLGRKRIVVAHGVAGLVGEATHSHRRRHGYQSQWAARLISGLQPHPLRPRPHTEEENKQHIRPKQPKAWPKRSKSVRNPEFGRNQPMFCRNRPAFRQTGSNLVELIPDLGEATLDSLETAPSQLRPQNPTLDESPLPYLGVEWLNIGRSHASLVEAHPELAEPAQDWPIPHQN